MRSWSGKLHRTGHDVIVVRESETGSLVCLWGIALAVVLVFPTDSLIGQSSSTTTQVVNQRNTIGVLTATPTSGVTVGTTVAFTYVLHTAGAPAPTSETVQFYDGASAIGSAQSIGSITGSNLLPYSQVSTANGWSAIGTPTVTPVSATGADGSTNTGTVLALPSSATQNQGVSYAITGISYASQTLTFSIWAKASAATALTLSLSDNPSSSATGTQSCALTTSYQRCTVTVAFPAGANAGFIASLYTHLQGTASVSVWGAQVEAASAPGPYVSTIGTARPTGGQGGSVSFSYPSFQVGSHSITAVYGGDSNFVTSTSNAVVFTVGQATPTVTLTANPASPQAYGTALTFTVAITGAAAVPTGTVVLMDNGTQIGTTTTLTSGSATFTFSGTASLAAGSHSLTAVYSGDTNYTTLTSSILVYTVSKVANGVTITVTSSQNPSVYGDKVTFTIVLASSAGGVLPTGTVTVVDTTTSTTIGTFTLNGSATTAATVVLFTAGSHSLTFTYSGDSNYQ